MLKSFTNKSGSDEAEEKQKREKQLILENFELYASAYYSAKGLKEIDIEKKISYGDKDKAYQECFCVGIERIFLDKIIVDATEYSKNTEVELITDPYLAVLLEIIDLTFIVKTTNKEKGMIMLLNN